jgi:hypothetical protein
MPRQQETEDEKRLRLERDAERKRAKRARETVEERTDRLEKDAARKRAKRAQEGADQRTTRLEENTLRNAAQREHETPEERTVRQEEDAARHALQRQEETPEQRAARLEEDAARHALQRQEETPEQRAARMEEDAASHALQRQQETPEQRTIRQEQNTAQMSQRRQEETPEQRAARQEEDAARHFEQRQQETPEQRTVRQEQDAARHAQQRAPDRRTYTRHPRGLGLLPLDRSNLPKSDLGTLSEECEHCHALYFKKEAMGTLCCRNGMVVLPDLLPYPEELKELLTAQSHDAKNFRKHIRKYNNSVAFASMGANIQNMDGGGPYCFKIQGQVYHRTGALHAEEGRDPMPRELLDCLAVGGWLAGWLAVCLTVACLQGSLLFAYCLNEFFGLCFSSI